MPSLSATVVQKAYKVEATTIYARISLNAAGTTATLITGSVAGGNPGASKGVASVSYTATGLYTITLDPSIPVQQFLGAPSIVIKNNVSTDATYLTRVYSTTNSAPGVGATLTIIASAATLPTQGAPIVSTGGVAELWVTIPFTTSNVW
jgi:hypothetical protein